MMPDSGYFKIVDMRPQNLNYRMTAKGKKEKHMEKPQHSGACRKTLINSVK